MRAQVGIAVAAIAVAVGACGNRPAPPPVERSSASVAGVTSSPAPADSTVPDSASNAAGRGAAASASTVTVPQAPMAPSSQAGGAAAPTPGAGNPPPVASAPSGLPLSVAVVPSCVTRGQPFEVRMTSAARAGFAMVIAYSDDQPHGAMGFGDADAQGRFVWRLVVAPDTPVGDAAVLVGAKAERPSDATASQRAPFSVAAEGGCP